MYLVEYDDRTGCSGHLVLDRGLSEPDVDDGIALPSSLQGKN